MVKIKKSITEGPMLFKVLTFTVPLMLTAILQLVYNMADNIVVGQFSGDPTALAAVGSTSSLTSLFTNLIFGIGGGVAVVIAQAYGAEDGERVHNGVHTAIISSVFCGTLLCLLGLIFSHPVLTLMGTKPELIDNAVLYFCIICIGFPAQTVYNFSAAILRAVGDTKTSLYILATTGIVNVALNLVFVIGCGMSVAGVALATVISQYLSAIAIVAFLVLRRSECYAFSFKRLVFDLRLFGRMLQYGVPAGIQGALFSISNILLTTASNTFSTEVVSAKAIASNVDNIAYTCMHCFLHASMTFTAQNFGARQPSRVRRSLFYSLLWVSVVGISLAALVFGFRNQLGSLFMDANDANKELILSYVEDIMRSILLPYFLCGIMEVLSGALRGLGYSVGPMITSLAGVCLMRILWIAFVFPLYAFHTICGLMFCYPVTWIITITALSVQVVIAWRRKLKPIEASGIK